jgi:protein-tyrosine phosphatase
MVKICFVCLGNICRSPTAEAVMRHLVKRADLEAEISVESAGTGDWHIGEPRDRRSQATAEARGMPLSGRAQQFTAADFARFDYVVAMDGANFEELSKMAPTDLDRAKVRLLRSFDATSPPGAGVPDPYYGGGRGFEEVFDICHTACRALLEHVRHEHRI